MVKLILTMIFAVAVIAEPPNNFTNHQAAASVLPHEKLSYPDIKFTVPMMQKENFSQGTELLYLFDPGSSVVRMAFYVSGGRHRDPQEKAGLSALLSAVQRSGGTASLSAEKLDEELANLGAEIKAESQTMYNMVEMRCLSRDFDQVLDLFFSVLKEPAFADNRFEVEKRMALDRVKRRFDDAATLASRKLVSVVYKGHPHGYEDSIQTISAIERTDLVTAHTSRFCLANSQLLVVGDIKLDELKTALNKQFQAWPVAKQSPSVSALVPMPLDFKGERFFIEKENPQFKIRLAHKSITIDNPDYPALQVMNYILGGGGFNSRMVRELRTEQGLAYSLYSYISADKFYGMFECSCDTGVDTAFRSLEQIYAHIEKIKAEAISTQELELAINAQINSFVFRFVTRWQVGQQLLFYRQRGLPENYLQKYLEEIKKVTIADVQRVAKKYLRPQDLKIMLVGPFSTVRAEMENRFGSFTEIQERTDL